MSELPKEIGEKLKRIRLEKGFSVREVGEQIGIHFTYVSKIEKGQKSSLEVLEKLCDFYGVPISSLFGKEQEVSDELKELGVNWITFAKDMDKENLTPEEIRKLIEVVKTLRGN